MQILEFIISDNGGEIWNESQIGSQCQTELSLKDLHLNFKIYGIIFRVFITLSTSFNLLQDHFQQNQ